MLFLQEQGVITKYCVYICDSTARSIFLGVLYGYKMVLQVIALVLAFSIRKVKVKGLDDAKFVGAAIYVTSIVLAVTIVGTYSLKDIINAFAALVCSGFLIGTTVILILVFVPLVSQTETCRSAEVRYCKNVTSLFIPPPPLPQTFVKGPQRKGQLLCK